MRVLALILMAQSAQAFLGGGDTNIQQSYPCVGLDGVPIASGSLAQQCCPNGVLIPNAPAICRAGFNTIQGDATGGAAFNLNLANDTLDVANNLNGSNTDFNNVNAPTSGAPNAPGAPTNPNYSGLVGGSSGASGGLDGMGGGIGNQSGADSSAGAGNSGGSMGAGGGAGGGLGLADSGMGSRTSRNPAGDGSNSGGTNSGSRGGFVSGSGGGPDSNAFALNFGNGDGSGNGVQGGSLAEMSFEEDGITDGGNGQVEGTVVDPSNYFSLTHPSDDLFKIVSRRYGKKIKKLADSNPQRLPAGNRNKNKPF